MCVGWFPTQVIVCDLRQGRAMWWLEEVTCGTALRAVWPGRCHTSRSELSTWFKYSSLPKVTGFHRKCSGIIHVGLRFMHQIWAPVPEVFHTGVIYSFHLVCWDGGKWNIIVWVEKETWPSSRLVCHHAVLFCTFSFEPSAISKNISYTVEICQTIFDGIYFKKPIDKGLLF